MSFLSRTVFAAAILAGTALPSFAWSVMEGWLDPIGGRTYTVAGATNDEGMSIVIFRDTDERVRALYSIPENSFDRLPNEGRVLAIRPGDHSVVEISAAYGVDGIVERARSDGRNVRASLWHGEGPSPTLGTLRNILDSDTLYARFFTDTGGSFDTSWSLDGAPEAIATALGISATASPDEVEWAAVQANLILSSVRRCGFNRDCISRMNACLDMLQSMADVEPFNRCVERVAP